jgi:tetratricopeptide (TPR) repeat protein
MSFGRHFPRHINKSDDWVLVYWDEKSTIYLKRLKRYADIISRYQYRVAQPSFYGFDYLQNIRMKKGRKEMLQGLAEDVRRAPQNQEVRLARAFYLFGENPFYYQKEILAELDATLNLEPDLAMEHSAKGYLLLQAGDKDGALQKAEEALRLDPSDKGGKFLLEKLGG